jgi:hypothetical protein
MLNWTGCGGSIVLRRDTKGCREPQETLYSGPDSNQRLCAYKSEKHYYCLTPTWFATSVTNGHNEHLCYYKWVSMKPCDSPPSFVRVTNVNSAVDEPAML